MRTVAVGTLLGGLITGIAGAQQPGSKHNVEIRATQLEQERTDSSASQEYQSLDWSVSHSVDEKPNIAGFYDRLDLQDSRGADQHYLRNPFSEKPLTDTMRVSLSAGRFGGRVFGYITSGSPHDSPSTFSYLPPYPGVGNLYWILNGNGSGPVSGQSQAYGIGYGWRNFELEKSTSMGTARNPSKPLNDELIKFSSRSMRLSFKPSPNWLLGISRGSISGLDQLVPNEGGRRTALAASYTQLFKDSIWQTTVGWGRNSRKFRESTTGYLLDSMLKFDGGHTLFGRLEQVGSDELLQQEESLERQILKLKKLTVGYAHRFRMNGSGPGNLDVGIMVSRYFIPAQTATSYGNNPTAYMMFVRVNLQ